MMKEEKIFKYDVPIVELSDKITGKNIIIDTVTKCLKASYDNQELMLLKSISYYPIFINNEFEITESNIMKNDRSERVEDYKHRWIGTVKYIYKSSTMCSVNDDIYVFVSNIKDELLSQRINSILDRDLKEQEINSNIKISKSKVLSFKTELAIENISKSLKSIDSDLKKVMEKSLKNR